MLQNAYFLAKIGADTAENEQHFAETLPETGNYPTGPLMSWHPPAARTGVARRRTLQACGPQQLRGFDLLGRVLELDVRGDGDAVVDDGHGLVVLHQVGGPAADLCWL